MFTVYFRNSTTTPSQPGLRTLVDAALRDCGAQWTGQEAELGLPDGSMIYLSGEDEDEGMLLEYPLLTEDVAKAVYALADRTTAFVIDQPFQPSAIRSAASLGEVRAVDSAILAYGTADDPSALHSWLSEIRETAALQGDESPPRQAARRSSSSSFEDRTFFAKLGDIIFGTKT